MFIERQRLLEFDALLSQLLCLKDADFTKFLNSDPHTVIKPFVTCLQAFVASQIDDDISSELHVKILKFLLRLCPSKKTEDNAGSTEATKSVKLKSVICPKKFAELLFETDPLGLLVYLFTTWNPSEYLDVIRDELVPSSFIKHFASKANSTSDCRMNEFIKWITKGQNSFKGALNPTEKESILKRFEYESDDDYFEGEDDDAKEEISKTSQIDPIEAILYATFISSPSTFSRTSEARKSAPRQSLLASTKLSHEQLEGWALMLERNPKKSNLIQNFLIWRTNQDK